jgi:hypothetical protein
MIFFLKMILLKHISFTKIHLQSFHLRHQIKKIKWKIKTKIIKLSRNNEIKKHLFSNELRQVVINVNK